MERLETKKSWSSPELIVIVRGKPEEAVLSACKNVVVSSGYSSTGGNCTQNVEPCLDCEVLPNS